MNKDWIFNVDEGQALPGGYVSINAQTYIRAGLKMHRLFSDRWCGQ